MILIFDYLAEDRLIIGDPEYCFEELVRYKEEAGIDYFILRIVFPEATHDIISD